MLGNGVNGCGGRKLQLIGSVYWLSEWVDCNK